MSEITSAHSYTADPASEQAVNMQRMMHEANPVHSPQALQHQLESIGSPPMDNTDWRRGPQELHHSLDSLSLPVFKYTDWHRQAASPAATCAASVEKEVGMDDLGAKLTYHGFGVAPGAGLALAGRAVATGGLPAGRPVAEGSVPAGRAWDPHPSGL